MNTPAHSPHPTSPLIAALEHLAPAWFALVMGWCGLAQAWLRAEPMLGELARGLGFVGACVALLIFVLLCLSCVIRMYAHPHAVLLDLRHPVRHAFMAALPISLLLLVTLGIQLFGGISHALDTTLTWGWCLGSVLEFSATVWVVSRWFKPATQGGMTWATFTPVFFIPVVGNVLTPLGGVPLGMQTWATAQLGVGMLLWPVMQTLLFVRLGQAGPLPARLSPTWFITLVPSSIVGLSLLQLHAPIGVVWGLWGMSVFFFCLVLTQVPAIRAQPFGLSHWGMSFPMAAFTTFTLRMSQELDGTWLRLPALVLLALTSLLILGLTLNTWHGLRRGLLLVPEN